jgi:tetratricopeptide (TPR) repeat protein
MLHMKTAETMYNEIQPMVENNWDKAAMSAYDYFLESYPTYAQAHFDLAMLCLKHQRDDDALMHLQESVELAPDNAVFSKMLADFYYAKKDDAEKAFEVYRRLVNMEPQNLEMHVIAGNLAVALHRFDCAIGYYEKVLGIDPGNADARDILEKLKAHMNAPATKVSTAEELYAQAQELVGAGDSGRAIAVLEQLVQAHPGFVLGHNDLGVLHSQAGETDKAEYHYEQARQLDPDNLTIMKNMAEFYFIQSGNFPEALRIGLNILKQDPEDTETLMMAGHINHALDRKDDARLFYSRVLEIEPWHFEASECLSKIENFPESVGAAALH